MLIAIIFEETDERGRTRYVVKWRYLGEEKPYYIMGGRPWKHLEIAVLVENKHDVPKVAKLLGRTEEACYKQLERLGISIKNVEKPTCVIFPKADADLRREFVKKLMPKLEKVLDKCLKSKDLQPEHYDHLIKLIKASAAMFKALEAWQTGAERLDIWRSEEEEEDADQSEQG